MRGIDAWASPHSQSRPQWRRSSRQEGRPPAKAASVIRCSAQSGEGIASQAMFMPPSPMSAAQPSPSHGRAPARCNDVITASPTTVPHRSAWRRPARLWAWKNRTLRIGDHRGVGREYVSGVADRTPAAQNITSLFERPFFGRRKPDDGRRPA
jgi:hypothetical protein